MKVLVSIDAEGLPGIYSFTQVVPKYSAFAELRKIMTEVAKVTAEVLKSEGFTEVWVADSHGHMGTVVYDEMPDYVRLVRGFPRPLSMVPCISEGFSATLFLGYHSCAGTVRSVLDHTYSSAAFHELRINGEKASEFYVNALVAGQYGVPVILVAGDDKLREEVAQHTPWAEYVLAKRSLARTSAVMEPLQKFLQELRGGISRAVKKLKDGSAKPLKVDGPVTLEAVMRSAEHADAAEAVPGIERVDAYTLKYVARDIIEAYNVIEVLALIAAGIESIKAKLSE